MSIPTLQKKMLMERLNLLSNEYKQDMVELYSEYNTIVKENGEITEIQNILNMFEHQFSAFIKK